MLSTDEVNRVLECIHAMMQDAQIAVTKQHVRLQFDLEGTHKEHGKVLRALKQSSVLESVIPLGPVQKNDLHRPGDSLCESQRLRQ